MTSSRISLLQMTSSNVIAENCDIVLSAAQEAKAAGSKILFTPENTHFMDLNPRSQLASIKYQDEDPTLKALQAAAKENDIWLHIGSMSVKVADNKLSNRCFVIANTGEIVATYDKIHLFDVDLEGGESYKESTMIQAGEQAVTVDTPIGTIGCSICYDLRFPYLYRKLATIGATIFTVPAAFTVPTGKAHWESLLRARAIENGAFVIAAAQGGTHNTRRETYGHSMVISPWGKVLLNAETTGLHTLDIDLNEVFRARSAIPSLQHTRALT